MQTAHHTAALAGYFLAPGPSPSPTSSSLGAQFHYAMSSWTPGARLLFLIIVVAVVAIWMLGRRRMRGGSQQ